MNSDVNPAELQKIAAVAPLQQAGRAVSNSIAAMRGYPWTSGNIEDEHDSWPLCAISHGHRRRRVRAPLSLAPIDKPCREPFTQRR